MSSNPISSTSGSSRTGFVFLALVAVVFASLFLEAKSLRANKAPKDSSALPMAKPEEVGLSSERIQRVHDAMQRHIDAKEIAGVITIIARNGRIASFDAQGLADIDTKRPMQKDNVFNWASATKPITATAILILAEEGKVRLTDPVSKYLPEFKNEKVRDLKPGATLEGQTAAREVLASSNLVPAAHDITIRDLLTHTSGLMSVAVPNPLAPQNDDLLSTTLDKMVPRFAAVPLDFQPGTKWAYSNWAGFDVLGRIVEVVSGKTFPEFLKERIFDPLGMKDTGFNPFGDARASRLAVRYGITPNGIKKLDVPTPWSTAKAYFSGAAGLSGSTEDYWRFCQMLANGGELNGKRLLSPETVELMRANHVGDLFPGSNGFPQKGMGFGYGVAVVADRVAGDSLIPNGTFGWVGASGVEGLVSPKENLVMIFMVGGGNNLAARTDFHTMVPQALIQ